MAGYLGASPVPQTIQKKQSFTATASQTTFTTTGYTDGQFINVYLNGVRLINGTDYTATNGSDIVLTTGASASDVLDFETFNEFTLVDQTLETPTFTDSADVTSTTTASLSVSGDTTATLSLKNNTHEDTDGGRESTLIFKGEQSGGEISTLAEIEASHDGTADDEKGDLIFRTNDGSDGSSPTERIRIDSSGNMTQSTSKDGDLQHIIENVNSGTSAQANLYVLNNSGVNHGLFAGAAGTSFTTTGGFFQDGCWLGSGTASSGGLSIVTRANAPIRFYTNGHTNERVRITNDGLTFNGDTAAANALDDYEEGTFTGTIAGHTTAGTQSGTISGKYVKVGTLIHCSISMSAVSLTGASGRLQISGMPFTAASLTTCAVVFVVCPVCAVVLSIVTEAVTWALCTLANVSPRTTIVLPV